MSETYTDVSGDDLTDDDLDPADLWADVPEPNPAPVPRIVLRDMEPEEPRSRLEELGTWLRWLVEVNAEARTSNTASIGHRPSAGRRTSSTATPDHQPPAGVEHDSQLPVG